MRVKKGKRGEPEDQPLTVPLSMKISESDKALLERVTGPLLSMSVIGRAALRFGLEAFERDPKLLEAHARPAKRGPKPKPK